MTISKSVLILIISLTIAGQSLAAGSGGGGGAITPTYDSNTRGLSPEQISDKSSRSGIKSREKAHKFEARAEKAKSDKARTNLLAKAQKAYNKAIEKQSEALRVDPQNYKAANELGYALRKTGDYRKAIGAYNYALELNANFHRATEYRGEAFLALGMLDLTKSSYLKLFRNDRTLANQLMTTIDKWATTKAEEKSEVEQEFLQWITERKRIAEMADKLSMHTPSTDQHHWPSS
ncbi:MAG: tetratricopeptide (TPR) repeat protein [Limisphaerales bacterium]|jgi:tetratricopeptide (TPR) repeat protein